MASKAQAEALARIVGKVRKDFGSESALVLGEGTARSQVREVVPTGIDVFDHFLLGCGGFPVGRMGEIYGEEGCGKTSLGYRMAAAFQSMGGVVQWVDSEQSFDVERAKVFGLDPDAAMLSQPDSLEQAVDIMRRAQDMVEGGMKLLTVWDSIATSPTVEELEKDASEELSMRRGGIIGRACRALVKQATAKQSSLLFINQVRVKIGVAFGSPWTTPGSKGPKFAATFRMHMMGGSAVKKGEVAIGKDLTFYMEKNRMAAPLRKAKVRLLYATGWDNEWSTFNHAKDVEAIKENLPFTPKNAQLARQKLPWPPPKEIADAQE